MATPLFKAMSTLTVDELYVIVSIYWGELSETNIAAELTDVRDVEINRNWVHRRRLTAEAKLRRALVDIEAEWAA